MTKVLMDAAEEVCEGKILFVLEGGYDLSGLTNSVKAVILQLRKTPLYVQDNKESPSSAVQQTVQQVKKVLRPHWGDF
jgi:acetoin utilization deacetylase AcuC-like enzyme